jgi:hypothetical protein
MCRFFGVAHTGSVTSARCWWSLRLPPQKYIVQTAQPKDKCRCLMLRSPLLSQINDIQIPLRNVNIYSRTRGRKKFGASTLLYKIHTNYVKRARCIRSAVAVRPIWGNALHRRCNRRRWRRGSNPASLTIAQLNPSIITSEEHLGHTGAVLYTQRPAAHSAAYAALFAPRV